MGDYGGESNAKKMSRDAMWMYLSNWRAKSGAQGKALFLSGPHGYDARVAVAHGWDPRDLIAVDQDPSAIESAKRTSGVEGVTWVCDSFESVIASVEDIGVIYFDACATAVRVAKQLASALSSRLTGSASVRHSNGRDFLCTRVVIGGMYGRDGKWMDDEVGGAAERRVRTVVRALSKAALDSAMLFHAERAISYNSRRVDADGVIRGVPMVHVGGLMARPAFLEGTRKGLQKRVVKSMHRKVRRKERKKRPLTVLRFGSDLEGEKLKAWAIDMLEDGLSPRDVAAMLCIPEGTVRAWLAHLTRGTYGDVPRLSFGLQRLKRRAKA